MQHVRSAVTENRWAQHYLYYEMPTPNVCNWGSVEGLDYRNQTRTTRTNIALPDIALPDIVLPNIVLPRNYRRRKTCVVMLFQRVTKTLVDRQTVRSQPIKPLRERG
jgi:hypothetical protein